eukprot:Skav216310  [mRNA]  locus=scaffold494:237971:238875:- [translate_table: standard]
MLQRSRPRLLRSLPVLVGVGGVTWAADVQGVLDTGDVGRCAWPSCTAIGRLSTPERGFVCEVRPGYVHDGRFVAVVLLSLQPRLPRLPAVLSAEDIVLPEEYKKELRTLHDQAATFDFPEAFA